jgi:hypothetical protein
MTHGEGGDMNGGRPRRSSAIRWALWSVFGASVAVTGCAGYQVGARSLFPTEIKTVHVPMFQSGSWRPDLGEWLTEAVIKEIETRTPYKVVSNPLADSVLTGRILWDNKRVVSENIDDEPRNLLYNAAVHVTWIDNSGRILAQSIISADTNFVPEAGQSVTTAEQTTIRHLASQIVSEMEAESW